MPVNVPEPVNVTRMFAVAGNPFVVRFPNVSTVCKTGWVVKGEPVTAPAGCVVQANPVAVAPATPILLEVTDE